MGVEFFDEDFISLMESDKRLYFSGGDSFDFQVCMDYYDIKGKLGKGGFGEVYLAYDKMAEKEVAIKYLNFSMGTTNI